MDGPSDILPNYEVVADHFNATRNRTLFEAQALKAATAPFKVPRVLDLGCGTGQPIAAALVAQGAVITGVDGAKAMLAHFKRHLPDQEAILSDMRGLSLDRHFDVILAWDSFFHLTPSDQRAMFPTFAAHAHPGTRLLFTSGPSAGTTIGAVGPRPVYHASLDPDEYRSLLEAHGFDVLWFRPDDPEFHGHSVWLAERRAPIAAV